MLEINTTGMEISKKKKVIVNKLILCDHRDGLAREEYRNTVNLCATDPTFFSGKNYGMTSTDENEILIYEDENKGGITHFINKKIPMVRGIYNCLVDNGIMLLHCDWHASHYIKVMCDGIFGYNNFLGEIIWYYKSGGRGKRFLAKKHDTILVYAKGKGYTFNWEEVLVDFESEMTEWSRKRDNKPMPDGKVMEDVIGVNDMTKEEIGWVIYIPQINGMANERKITGAFKGQKPEELYEILIKAFSNKGDLVLDPNVGSGTTLAVAKRLGRRILGMECSIINALIARFRVGISDKDFEEMEIKERNYDTVEKFWFIYQTEVCKAIGGIPNGKGPDHGIDGYLTDGTPYQAKSGAHVKSSDVTQFIGTCFNRGLEKGVIAGMRFPKPAMEEIALARSKGLLIEVVDTGNREIFKSIIPNINLEDYIEVVEEIEGDFMDT